MYGYYRPEYSAQEMLTTYYPGRAVGNSYGEEAAPGAGVAQLAGSITGLAATLIGGLVASKQAKKQREQDAEMAKYQAEVAAINLKNTQLQAAAAKERTTTLALVGVSGLMVVGALGFVGILLLRKR